MFYVYMTPDKVKVHFACKTNLHLTLCLRQASGRSYDGELDMVFTSEN